MQDAAALPAQAVNKRASAALARRTGSGRSLLRDQTLMLELSRELDVEAAGLDLRADEIERLP
jgi:hypothetical protein